MDHVVWCDVTNRGYTVVDITPSAVSSHWWFVHPYDDDPAAGAELAAGFSVDRGGWPPRLEPDPSPAADPQRPGLPVDLPARPGDLGRLRRRRRRRIILKALAVAVGAVALVALPVAAVRPLRPARR
jgi:hypothetical protein